MNNCIKRGKILTAAFLMILVATSSSWAINLSFSPEYVQKQVSDSLSVDLMVSGLEETNLAGFDLTVNFDDTILSFLGYSLGDGLGESMDLSGGDSGAGMFHIGEASLEWDLGFQPDSFSLATLSFEGIAEGLSDLFLSDVTLADDWGNSLQASLGNGSVLIGNTSAVPEPTTMTLFGLGLILMAGINRNMNRKA
jgi:hypothetical protein